MANRTDCLWVFEHVLIKQDKSFFMLHTYWLFIIGACWAHWVGGSPCSRPTDEVARNNSEGGHEIVTRILSPSVGIHISLWAWGLSLRRWTLSDTWRDGASAPKRVAQRHCCCPKLGADDVVHRRGHRFCLRCDQRVGADRQHHPHQDVLLCQIHPQRAEPVHVQPGAGRCFTAGDLRPGGREPLPVRGVAVRESGL